MAGGEGVGQPSEAADHAATAQWQRGLRIPRNMSKACRFKASLRR
jgi:hypothetical protein